MSFRYSTVFPAVVPAFQSPVPVAMRSAMLAKTAVSARALAVSAHPVATHSSRWRCTITQPPATEEVTDVPMELPQSTVSIIKSTVPVLVEHGPRIAGKFYRTLFERYPQVRPMFNVDRQRGGVTAEDGQPAQIVALVNSLIAFARKSDKIAQVSKGIEAICQKHVSRGVTAEQYPAVGECFLFAMQAELGDAATPEIVSAWQEAFGVLARLYVAQERKLQDALEERAGYRGFADMDVKEIETTDSGGRRITLKPVSVGVPKHQKGQFVSIAIEKEGTEPTMTSMEIVDGSEDSLCIDVRPSKERGSRYLLDDVQVGSLLKVSIPCGKFSA